MPIAPSPERRLVLLRGDAEVPLDTSPRGGFRVVLVRHNRVMWGAEVDAYIDYLRSTGASDQTLRVRRGQIERALTWMNKPTWDVRLDDMVAYSAAHPYWKPETRKAIHAAMKGLYAWGESDGRVPDDYARRLPSVRVPSGKPRPAPTSVVEDALLRASEREQLMVKLAAWAGLRRAEIAAVHTDDIVGDLLRVTGKGGKTRTVPLLPALHAELLTHTGYVFPGKDNGHLSPDRVGRILSKLLGSPWTAHTLRHRFASRAYSAERDMLAVRDMLGHASVATTQRYTETPDDAQRRAILAVA